MTSRPSRRLRGVLALSLLAPAALVAEAGPRPGGATAAPEIVEVSHGFGHLLPHRIFALDGNGNPTGPLIDIRTLADLLDNATPQNPVFPVPSWPAAAVLPDGSAGSHFVAVRLSQPIDIDSVLDPAPGSPSGLTGALTVVALDPLTGASTLVQGRGFLAGWTRAGTPTGSPPTVPLARWVHVDGAGDVVADAGADADGNGVPDGLGFPGTESSPSFAGAADLVRADTFVFVPDSDGDLSTHERFPAGRTIRIRISEAVLAADGSPLTEAGLAAGTVGDDSLPPEVGFAPPPLSAPLVVPGNGDVDVDPRTDVRIEFTEPVQPLSVGDLPTGGVPGLSAAVRIEFGPAVSRTTVPFTAVPASPFDLSTYVLDPVFDLPGAGPGGACGPFNQVDVSVLAGGLSDLAANQNLLSVSSFFLTGEGPGLVNAPVTPAAVYFAATGAEPSLSVIDLDGFGASTGNPAFDPTFQTFQEGDSNYPNNPNVRFQGTLLRPPLALPTCTFAGGSAGVFTRTLDSNLDPRLVRAPLIRSIADLMLGHALDSTFRNAPAPFGCQSGGGNLCALDGLKVVSIGQGGPNTLAPFDGGGALLSQLTAAENPVSWAPHPNPPPLVFPPLCVSPHLGGQEPTSIDSALPPPDGSGFVNLLVPGDPFGDPANGIPPSGLLSPEQNAFFQGPSPPNTNLTACNPYMLRQQVGQFLYLADRAADELVVLSSNRMRVVDRIAVSDPTELAMSGDLTFLAVSSQATDSVVLIDIDPSSSTFHQVVHSIAVGSRPRGIAWEPGGEDLVVANEGDGTLSLVSGFSLQVRKVVDAGVARPFAVAVTPRQAGFGWRRNVWFAWVLGREGRLALFESGPDGVNGWGYDDVVAVDERVFPGPRALQPDPLDLGGAVWIAHEGSPGSVAGSASSSVHGALSRVRIESSVVAPLLLDPNVPRPTLRKMTLQVDLVLGADSLTGVPVDLAFDDLRNLGGLPNLHTSFSAGVPAPVNGKHPARLVAGLARNTNEARYLFAAVPSRGVVDVLDLSAGGARIDTNAFRPGLQSVPAPGVARLASYFRQ